MTYRNLVILLLLFAGCKKATESCDVSCKKADITVTAINFKTSDIDTVIVRKYNIEDTSVITTTFYNSSFYRNVNDSVISLFTIQSDYDWQIEIPRYNLKWDITDIRHAGPFTSKSDCVQSTPCTNQIESYKVNGQTTTGRIKLRK